MIAPDVRRILDDIKTRLSILERRITNAGRAAATPGDNGHPGEGDESIALGARTTATGDMAISIGPDAIASGTNSVVIGEGSEASGLNASALGPNITASGNESTAVGYNSLVSGVSAVAVGTNAGATGEESLAVGFSASAVYDRSAAIGSGASTFAVDTIVIGRRTPTPWVILRAPSTAIASSTLDQSQISFSIDETGHNLIVKVKYSDTTVKTATVPLT